MRGIVVLSLLFCWVDASAQKFTLEKSDVGFFSHAAIEDIKATNKNTTGLYNSTSSDIVFSIPIAAFKFKKSLMQEHFNEKYMESEKYPKATFQGKLDGFDASKSGVQQVKAVGKMTIHGVTKNIEVSGTAEKQAEHLLLKAKFPVKLVDYNITIPQLLWQKIAEEVEVSVDFTFKSQGL